MIKITEFNDLYALCRPQKENILYSIFNPLVFNRPQGPFEMAAI